MGGAPIRRKVNSCRTLRKLGALVSEKTSLLGFSENRSNSFPSINCCKKEGVKTNWQELMPPRGLQVLPRRWVVERTFSWIDHNRRMSKDYERLAETSEAFIYLAMSRLMVRRLTRS